MSDPPAIRLPGGLCFDPPVLLAPMDGVTDRSFRSLVLECNGPGALGGACTEFLRASQHPLPARRFREELGEPRTDAVVGVQIMGNEAGVMAASAVHAAEAGAPFVDLNFGCPAPRVFQHCAGSALLEDPPALEAIVRAVVDACPVPVTAKIRAGGERDDRLEEIARRVEQAGSAALTVHGRLRVERYSQPTDWRRIARAVAAVSIPVIGNGSAESAAAIDAMLAETGCAGVMVGRGALGNPWIFREWRERRRGRRAAPPSTEAVGAWLSEYARRMVAGGATPLQASGRLKQSAKAMGPAGLLPAGADLHAALRCHEPQSLLGRLGFGAPAAVTAAAADG